MRLTCLEGPGGIRAHVCGGRLQPAPLEAPQALPPQLQGELPPVPPSPCHVPQRGSAQPGALRAVPALQGVVRAGWASHPCPHTSAVCCPLPNPFSLPLWPLFSQECMALGPLACGRQVNCLGPWPGIGGGDGAAPTPSQPSAWGEEQACAAEVRLAEIPPTQDLPHCRTAPRVVAGCGHGSQRGEVAVAIPEGSLGEAAVLHVEGQMGLRGR